MEPFRSESSPGARAMALVDALARHTDEPGRLTRLYLSPAHRATAEATLGMMREAGLEARIDAVGNVIGRREGRERGAPALIIGSHIDSVVDAGRFDGTLGVVAGIVAAEALAREGERLPFAIEVVGVRRRGERPLPDQPLDLPRACRPLPPRMARRPRRRRRRPARCAARLRRRPGRRRGARPPPRGRLGYLEVHIEQGPLLEAEGPRRSASSRPSPASPAPARS